MVVDVFEVVVEFFEVVVGVLGGCRSFLLLVTTVNRVGAALIFPNFVWLYEGNMADIVMRLSKTLLVEGEFELIFLVMT